MQINPLLLLEFSTWSSTYTGQVEAIVICERNRLRIYGVITIQTTEIMRPIYVFFSNAIGAHKGFLTSIGCRYIAISYSMSNMTCSMLKSLDFHQDLIEAYSLPWFNHLYMFPCCIICVCHKGFLTRICCWYIAISCPMPNMTCSVHISVDFLCGLFLHGIKIHVVLNNVNECIHDMNSSS